MKVVEVQFTPWDKVYYFDPKNLKLKIGDFVIVKTELGQEVGQIVGFKDLDREGWQKEGLEIKPVIKKAQEEDFAKIKERAKQKKEALRICKELTQKHQLNIKLIDVYFSFDGGRITYAFIANGRIDFRELVKDLTHHWQKSVRLIQLGPRDEARINGDVGTCGLELCCQGFVRKFQTITTELAELQQIAHRGPERLSGPCGRLKCCLAFEQKTYEEYGSILPPLGSIIKTERGEGKVVARDILRQTVKVEVAPETVVEVAIK